MSKKAQKLSNFYIADGKYFYSFFHCVFVQMSICSAHSRCTKAIACQVCAYDSKVLTHQLSRLGTWLEGAIRPVHSGSLTMKSMKTEERGVRYWGLILTQHQGVVRDAPMSFHLDADRFHSSIFDQAPHPQSAAT